MTSSRGTGRWSVLRGPWSGGVAALPAGLAVLAILLLVRSLATIGSLNVRAVSYYAFADDALFAGAILVLAVASVLVLAGLVGAGVPVGGVVTGLSAVWCAGLTLCAVFPTDNNKSVVSTSGMVHQVAGASLFVSLPLAGLALTRRLVARPPWARTARAVRSAATVSLLLAAAYLLARLPDVLPWPDFLDLSGISGLLQRVLFGLEMVMLGLLAMRLLRVSLRGPAPARFAEASG